MATDSTPDVNRAHFDEVATSYDQRYKTTIDQLIGKIREWKGFISVDWVDDDEDGEGSPKTVRLLDYACGTGLLSMALAQFTTQCVGVDISPGMVDVYNSKVDSQGLTKDEMFAVVGNLTDPEDPSPAALSAPEFWGFDVAGVCMGFHHFADPELTARRLVERLRPGGVFVILDFVPHAPVLDSDGHDHGHGHGHAHGHGSGRPEDASHTVSHNGFSEERVRSIFEQAGAGTGFKMEAIGTGFAFRGGDRKVFIARGVKT